MDIEDVKVGQKLRRLYRAPNVQVTAIGNEGFLAKFDMNHYGGVGEEFYCDPENYEPADNCLYVVLVKLGSGRGFEVWDDEGAEQGVPLDEAIAIAERIVNKTQIVPLEEHML